MNSIAEQQKVQIKENKTVTINRINIKINSAINDNEGQYITHIINKYACKNALEIGMAFGISALYILSASPKIKLISIDPFQSTQWNSAGINLLKECRLISRHKLVEDKSYNILPKILLKMQGKIDFIFIDGWHTFDYTLVDFFYSSMIIKVGGIIVIDDAKHKGVGACIDYIAKNYKHFRKLQSVKTMACFIKMAEDSRDWNFHR